MQKNLFTLICLYVLLLLLTGQADAKNSNRIITAVRLSATINKLNQHAEIRWYTSPGQNNMLRFELQKSADGNAFSYVTSVAGDRHNNLKQYFAEDRNLLNGNNFYRLRIIYKDGYEAYSSITQIAPTAPSATILPSVAKERLYIWMPENVHVSRATVSDIFR